MDALRKWSLLDIDQEFRIHLILALICAFIVLTLIRTSYVHLEVVTVTEVTCITRVSM